MGGWGFPYAAFFFEAVDVDVDVPPCDSKRAMVVTGRVTMSVALPEGVYAFAYRFVREATGQQTEWIRLPGLTVVG